MALAVPVVMMFSGCGRDQPQAPPLPGPALVMKKLVSAACVSDANSNTAEPQRLAKLIVMGFSLPAIPAIPAFMVPAIFGNGSG